ncbi:unnamed protein product [Rotaria sordida]|uniref:Uncharacterized protein n=1 Tax=Rotaria sordida TaxID=392033 RepID=A0A819FHU8_9BILA|nr:unnamed protein product [Rotaria sordida]CAF3869080.1 unnamed protein product [Rotaria sordida]
MSSKLERPSSLHDLIDDIIETPSSSNPISFRLRNTSKALQNRNYLSFSSIPSLFDKSRFEQTGHSLITLTNELHDHAHVTLPRSNSSIISMSNDDRRKEIDLIIKYLYDGKLLTTINDDHAVSDVSDPSMHMLNKGPITTTTTTTPIVKNDEENNNNVGNIDFLPLDIDTSTLQRELQEKELDIIHLHKEIQELQLENKLLKAKVPTVYSNDYASNNSEIEALRREKEILQNELHTSQELIAKFQQQQQHSVRSNKIDEITLQQKEILEKKLKFYEKQMRTLTDENEKLKQNLHQTERIIAQYKRENEELQQKVTEAKKHNDELFFQEFNSFRNDLKMLKQRNNELCEQNLRLQQEKLNFSWHSSTHEQQQQQQQQMPSSSSLKISNSDTKNLKISRSESPNISEASDSTNYLATVSIDRYHTRPSSSAHRSRTVDENHHCYRTKKYNSFIGHEDIHRNNSMTPLSKSIDQQFNFHSSKIQRAIQWNEENIPKNEGNSLSC